jgi:hypothetical protein
VENPFIAFETFMKSGAKKLCRMEILATSGFLLARRWGFENC